MQQARPAPTTQPRHGLSRPRARELCDRVLSFSRAEAARVTIRSGLSGFTRVAENRITTAGGAEDVTIQVMSVFGRRVASATTNAIDDAALAEVVRRSEVLARLAPEDPEYMGELGPQAIRDVGAYYASTGDLSAEDRGRAAAQAIEAARRAGLVAAGFIDVQAGSRAVATSAGAFAYHASTGVASTLTVRTPAGDSSGWAGDEASDWGGIENERVATEAARKCRLWRGRRPLEPGRYTVILEPTAAGMLMLRLMGDLNARPADEGRSYFSRPGGGNRIGEKLFDERVTIVSDPAEPDAETASFTGEGLPIARTPWVVNGILNRLAYSRFWAERQGQPPLPPPPNLIMSGGGASLEAMIQSTERGVLITRFWYIRGLNPRTLAYTGLTRDGTFLIEGGQVVRPVNNFRFNQSLGEMLKNLEMLGQPTRVAASENSSVGLPIVVPALKVRDFHLSSVSDAI